MRETRGTLALVLAVVLFLAMFRVPRGSGGDLLLAALEVLFAAATVYGVTSLHDFER